ncbi:MAG: BRCT domain-containing protein, partial [Patescibacteria group bacterium]
RDDAKALVRSHGGEVSESVSKKTTYVVVGADPGSKLRRAESLGVRTLDLVALRVSGARNGLPDRGALVRDDKRGGKMANAKIKIGDVIESVDRDILDGRADLGEILAEYKPNAEVTLRILRDGKTLDVPETLGSILTSEAMK